MKKIYVMALLMLVFCLSGCKSDAVVSVEQQISSLSDHKTQDWSKIRDVGKAYDALSSEDKVKVGNYDLYLEVCESYYRAEAKKVVDVIDSIKNNPNASARDIELAMNKYFALRDDAEKYVENADYIIELAQKSAAELDSLIDTIGEVDINDEERIHEAETTYNSMTELEKRYVEKVDVLKAAGEKLTELYDEEELSANRALVAAVEELIDAAMEDHSKIGEANNKYNELSAELKAMVKNVNGLYEVKADAVSDVISMIGEVTLDKEQAIDGADQAYSALSDEEKAYVHNYEELTAAKKRLAELKREQEEKERDERYKNLLQNINYNHDEVDGITWYESKNQPQYINERSFVAPYLGVLDTAKKDMSLRIKYDYVGNKWVLYDEITIVTDLYKYTIEPPYFDVHRDYGNVKFYEVYDALTTEDDVKMLRDMAKSEKVIVRFRGDHDYEDFTLDNNDKQMIQDIIDIYDTAQQEYSFLLYMTKISSAQDN